MIDLSERLGFKAGFSPEDSKFCFDNPADSGEEWKKSLASKVIEAEKERFLWQSMMFAQEFTDSEGNITTCPELKRFYPKNPDSVLYSGYRGVGSGNPNFSKLALRQLRFDLTLIPPGGIGKEFMRTEGHEHLLGFPEIYSVIYGRAGFLLWTMNIDRENDAMFAEAGEGEHVIFPPGYAHISINTGGSQLILADIVSKNAGPRFMRIKTKNGGPWWGILKENQLEFVKNPRFKDFYPDGQGLRRVIPAPEVPKLGLRKGMPLWELSGKVADNLNFLNYTNTDRRDDELYAQAFLHYNQRL